MSSAGYVNQTIFIEAKKDVSHRDVKNQMIVVEALLRYHYKVAPLQPPYLKCLLDTLCESLLSKGTVFREGAILSLF